jgi:hypothetical protein
VSSLFLSHIYVKELFDAPIIIILKNENSNNDCLQFYIRLGPESPLDER